MEIFLFLLSLGVLVQSINALSCVSCDKTECVQPINCKDGLVKGICGCCDVCAKTNGERCGGSWNMYGVCARRLKCVARERMDKENDFLPKHFHIGICEPDVCENKRCGFRKTCKINRRGEPVCICPRNCGKVRRPVCGLVNGKQYRNRCKLTREECLTKKEIGLVHGSCKKCSYQGRQYTFGAARPETTPCETCICRHSSWECQLKPNCSVESIPNSRNNKRTCLVSSDGKHIVLPCPKGFSCSTPSSDEKPHVVRVGICKKKKVNKPKKKSFLLEILNDIDIFISEGNGERTRVTESVPKLQVPSMFPPKENTDLPPTIPEQSSKKQQQIGLGLIQRVCMIEPDKTTCRPSSLTRWFYNASSKTCEEFQYGGCSGNFNNFISKEKCHEVCHSGINSDSVNPTPSAKLYRTTEELSNRPDKFLEMCHDMKTGRSYHEQEKWNIDECTSCSCVRGRSHCIAETCHTWCSNPIYLKGICCPICEPKTEYPGHTVDNQETRCKETETGISYDSGESWNNGECVDCICFEGQISCMRSACNIPYCDNPVKQVGQCCPECREDEPQGQVTPPPTGIDIRCQDNESGKHYRSGEGWIVNDCVSCFCGNHGETVCHELSCMEPKCKNPVHLQGRCCPICPDSFLSACTYNDHQYFEGDFTLLGDMCTLCKCNGNEWKCNEKHCNKTENGIRSTFNAKQKTLDSASMDESHEEKLDDPKSNIKENYGFIVEDPIRMSRRGKTVTTFEPSEESSSHKEFLNPFTPETPTTKSDQTVGYAQTDKTIQEKEPSTTKSDSVPRNKLTDMPPLHLLKEYKDTDPETNNTVVYRSKRL